MKVFCIISDERAFRSRSPKMHNTVLRQLGIDGCYVPFSVEPSRLGNAVKGLRALNIAGANVTVPYKEAVMPFLDDLSETASSVGAVNTIVRAGDRLEGHNTDADGFIDSLTHAGFNADGKRVLVFGTGGAAKAVLFALQRSGATHIILAGRSKDKTASLACDFDAEPVEIGSLPDRALQVELIVNTTTVSSRDEGPHTADTIARPDVIGCNLVADLNYGRAHNIWQELAGRLGAGFTDGLPMLAYQARRSFLLWTAGQVEPSAYLEALKGD
jgi:shikimate dehydrogenase